MQLALCEDSIADQGQIEECFCAVGKALDMNICVDSYTRAEDLLKKIETGYRYDAYILDIFMEKMDGITLTKEIRKRDREAKIAFITSSREFAVEAFEIRAIHYLLKPVTEGHVRELLERLTIAEKKTEPVFTFNSGKNSILFKQEDIVTIESYNHGVFVYKRDRKEPYWFRMLFMDVEQQASDFYFAKANRGILINLRDVERLEKQSCYMKDGRYISVSRKQITDLKKAYVNYLFTTMDGDFDVDM